MELLKTFKLQYICKNISISSVVDLFKSIIVLFKQGYNKCSVFALNDKDIIMNIVY